MSSRTNTMDAVELYIEILQRIPRTHKITTKQLHEQLKEAGYTREKRTIERHLVHLCEKFAIERDESSRPYGYRWVKGSQGISLSRLSEQESLLLLFAEQQLANLLPASLMKSMESFFAQAQYNLGTHDSQERNKEWLTKVRVVSETQPLIAPKVKSDVFEQVSNALYNNKWLHLEYQKPSGKQSKAEVMPLGLAQQGTRFYLVCRYKGFSNERSLALHRIVSAKASTLSFDRPPEFDLQKYDDDGRFGFGEGRRIKLTFRINKVVGAHLLESKLSKDQTEKEIGTDYEITATVVDSAQLKWWLRGFGEHVSHVVREPIEGII